MGTSKNVRSPDIPPWKPFLAVVGRPDIPVERQARELWRAAYADRGSRLEDDFSQNTLAVACELAATSRSVQVALREYDSANQREHRAGLGVEIGRRVLARAIARGTGAAGFAADFFADASSYYASRDLPSFIGSLVGSKIPRRLSNSKMQSLELLGSKYQTLEAPDRR